MCVCVCVCARINFSIKTFKFEIHKFIDNQTWMDDIFVIRVDIRNLLGMHAEGVVKFKLVAW